MHRVLRGPCATCHSATAWTPVTFDHRDHFVLDRDHDVACTTCHRDDAGQPYTCYGCHEHTPDRIRRQHLEEGIRDYASCVECHRSAEEPDMNRPAFRAP